MAQHDSPLCPEAPTPGSAVNGPQTPASPSGFVEGKNPVHAQPRLLDRVRREIRVRHYSIRTESAYVDWIRRFIIFNDKRHPDELGPSEVAAFLTYLAVDRRVAPTTQAQAKSAILFLYKVVLDTQLPWLEDIVAAKSARR